MHRPRLRPVYPQLRLPGRFPLQETRVQRPRRLTLEARPGAVLLPNGSHIRGRRIQTLSRRPIHPQHASPCRGSRL